MRRQGRKPSPKSVTLAGVAIMEVDNPHYSPAHAGDRANPRTISVAVNTRESYVTWLWARGVIDAGERQAADRLRAAYDKLGGSGAQAIDYGREHVDGGKIAQTITDFQLSASKTLRDALSALGPEGYDLSLKLACEGHWPETVAGSDAARRYKGMRFRECLETLAIHWGLKMTRIRSLRS